MLDYYEYMEKVSNDKEAEVVYYYALATVAFNTNNKLKELIDTGSLLESKNATEKLIIDEAINSITDVVYVDRPNLLKALQEIASFKRSSFDITGGELDAGMTPFELVYFPQSTIHFLSCLNNNKEFYLNVTSKVKNACK